MSVLGLARAGVQNWASKRRMVRGRPTLTSAHHRDKVGACTLPGPHGREVQGHWAVACRWANARILRRTFGDSLVFLPNVCRSVAACQHHFKRLSRPHDRCPTTLALHGGVSRGDLRDERAEHAPQRLADPGASPKSQRERQEGISLLKPRYHLRDIDQRTTASREYSCSRLLLSRPHDLACVAQAMEGLQYNERTGDNTPAGLRVRLRQA